MKIITIESEIKAKVPNLQLGCIYANVGMMSKNIELWDLVEGKIAEVAAQHPIDDIATMPVIAASRGAYKACGKDPLRYRLSAESLLRRVISGKGLYQISNVVDIINLVSIQSGFSIGGYDADQIEGGIKLGIGKENEPYEGIGRGQLNIEGMPALRDSQGAFGTPTSDSLRTSIDVDTRSIMLVFYNFDANKSLPAVLDNTMQLLKDYASGASVTKYTV